MDKISRDAPSKTNPPTPYQPANGLEGIEFCALWCARCMAEEGGPFDDDGKVCPILTESYAIKAGDEGYPVELIEDANGDGMCTAYIERLPGQEGWLDPRAVAKDRERYEALPRDPVTGRPVIA